MISDELVIHEVWEDSQKWNIRYSIGQHEYEASSFRLKDLIKNVVRICECSDDEN